MNKTLFTLLLAFIAYYFSGCLVMAVGAAAGRHRKAQPNKNTHEVSVGVGAYSGTELVDGLNFGDDVNVGTVYNTHPVFASYHYYVSDRIALGGALGYQQYQYYVQPYGNAIDYYKTESLATLAAEMKAVIFDSRNFQFYYLLGAGGTLHTNTYSFTDNSYPPSYYSQYANGTFVGFNFQTSAGISVGNNICWFGELGIGYKGAVHTGLTFHFGQPARKGRVYRGY